MENVTATEGGVPTTRAGGWPVAIEKIKRDPWFGEVSICARGGTVRFAAVKSPRLSGRVKQVDGRRLVEWDNEAADVEPWLDFGSGEHAGTLAMAKVDPDGDFSSDYEDLAFVRVRDCD